MQTMFLEQVRSFFASRGVEAYLVGGYVRDLVLGVQSNDIDIAVRGDAIALTRALADAIHGHFVLLDQENCIARVVSGAGYVYADISRLRGDDLRADLAARDFTFNALALPLADSSLSALVDIYGGRNDLKAQRVRAISERIFQDDPVRLVRATRFAAQRGYAIDPATAAWVRRDAPLLARVAGERVRDEFVKLLTANGAWRNLHLLDELGLLSVILPEMDVLRGVAQPQQHFYDVFNHTLAVVDGIEATLQAIGLGDGGQRAGAAPHPALPRVDLGGVTEHLRAHLAETIAADRTRLVTLKLGALFHDIAKPQARSVDEQGETHFYDHPMAGLVIAEEAMRRLKFSAREMHIVSVMVANHMRPAQIAAAPDVTRRAVYRYFRDTAAEGVDTLLLSLADHLGARGPKLDPGSWWRHAQFTRLMLEFYYTQPQPILNQPKLISGQDIMRAFALPAGPQVGELLEAVREAQAAGEVTTRDEALALVRVLLAQERPEQTA